MKKKKKNNRIRTEVKMSGKAERKVINAPTYKLPPNVILVAPHARNGRGANAMINGHFRIKKPKGCPTELFQWRFALDQREAMEAEAKAVRDWQAAQRKKFESQKQANDTELMLLKTQVSLMQQTVDEQGRKILQLMQHLDNLEARVDDHKQKNNEMKFPVPTAKRQKIGTPPSTTESCNGLSAHDYFFGGQANSISDQDIDSYFAV